MARVWREVRYFCSYKEGVRKSCWRRELPGLSLEDILEETAGAPGYGFSVPFVSGCEVLRCVSGSGSRGLPHTAHRWQSGLLLEPQADSRLAVLLVSYPSRHLSKALVRGRPGSWLLPPRLSLSVPLA